MIDNIELLQLLFHLWSNVASVYEYKHIIPDLSKEIEDLYKFHDVKLYGNIIRYGDYNYVFTTESDNYKKVLAPLMNIIDDSQTKVEVHENHDLKTRQFVVRLYIDIAKSYDNISQFVYKSTGSLPIFGKNTFFVPGEVKRNVNSLELVALNSMTDARSILESDRVVEFKGGYYNVSRVVLSGYSLWNMILDIKRLNKSSIYIQFKPYALDQLQKYCYQNKDDSFAILLNGKLFSSPVNLLKGQVFDYNMFQLAYNLDEESKIDDELKDESLLHIYKDALLGYGEIQVINHQSVNYDDSLFSLFMGVLMLLLLLFFFLLVRRRNRRKIAISTALSSIYVSAMFDGHVRVVYLSFLFIDLLFALFRDKFTVYIYKVSLYVFLLFVSFFVNTAAEIFMQSVLKILFMSTGLNFIVENLLSHRYLELPEEDNNS